MSNLNSNKNKHLTFDERHEIQECLNKAISFKAIAARIGKDPTTISKEVKKHLDVQDNGVRKTDQTGKSIAPEICPFHLKAPFVCNPCANKHRHCKYPKRYYDAKHAQQAYEALLSEAREGIPLNQERFYEVDQILTEGVKQGQHLYHILQSNDLGVSKSTVYRHLQRGYLSISPLDFPRVVKFKPRKHGAPAYVPQAAKVGRTYEDFLAFTSAHHITTWVEMDTVIGRVGGKVMLTLDFTFCNFMLGLLLEHKTTFEVVEKLTGLKDRLAEKDYRFGELVPLILTDNGGEFAHVSAMEANPAGQSDTRLFFCDPYRSCQKPHVEKNHTLLRDIVPQGSSFDAFTQDTVNLIFSHVNSVKRKHLGGKTPCEMFAFTYGESLTTLLGIESIPPQKVIQSPKLLK